MSIENRALQGRKLSDAQKERLWMREMITQIPEINRTMDNLYQNLAAIARLLKVKPEKLVKAVQERDANYAFLMACMQEEQKLNKEREEKLKTEASPETKEAIKELAA